MVDTHALTVRYIPNSLTVPAGTVANTPLTANWNLGNVVVQSIEVLIPPGHSGLTGFSVSYANVVLVPFSQNPAWLIGNDLDRTFDMVFPISSPLKLSGYNADIFDHTFYLLAKVTDPPEPGTGSRPALLDLSTP